MRHPPRLALTGVLLAALAIGWLASLGASPTLAEQTAVSANLLANPSFEGSAWPQPEGNASGLVATGWRNWFINDVPSPDGPVYRAPEWLPENIEAHRSHMVLRGEQSQKIFATFGVHDAGNFQVVSGLTPGQTYEFSVWVKVWSSQCGDPCFSPGSPCDPNSSNTHGEYRVKIGVDPTGAAPPIPGAPPSTVVWTDSVQHYDEFFQMKMRVVAQSDRMTVYTRGTPKWPVTNNFSFWDEAELRVVTGTETPASTSTVYATVVTSPTATRTVTPTRTPTATRTTTATPSPTVTTGPQLPRAFLPLILQAQVPPATPTPTNTVTATVTATVTQTPPPTLTPTVTQTAAPATVTPTLTLTPTATATPPALACNNPVVNGGFEGDGGWSVETAVPYPAAVVASEARSGERALRLGPDGAASEESFSYAWQAVAIPTGLERATLTWWMKSSGGDASDMVDVVVYSAGGVPVARLLRQQPAAGEWQPFTADLGMFAGATVQLWFNAYNDGSGQTLRVLVDDVRLDVCVQPSEQAKAPLATQTPVALSKPQLPTRKTTGVNVHFQFVRYSPEQIDRSRYCPECMIEWATLINNGDPVDMAGWTVTNERGDRFVFPSFTLGSGEQMRLWTGEGSLTRTQVRWRDGDPGRGLWDVYWGSKAGLFANAHDEQTGRLTLVDPQGRQSPVSICWGPSQKDPGGCN